jgi:hypothetical protein
VFKPLNIFINCFLDELMGFIVASSNVSF